MKALVEKLPDIKDPDEPGLKGSAERWPNPAEGAALRELRTVLDKVNTKRDWGGLRKVLTPEGDYLWLCEQHAQEYRDPTPISPMIHSGNRGDRIRLVIDISSSVPGK